MALTDQDVDHVARLARLALTEAERSHYRGQLTKILDHIARLSAYDTTDTAPTSHVAPAANAWREDAPRRFEDVDTLLAGAPEREDVFFKVKQVIA